MTKHVVHGARFSGGTVTTIYSGATDGQIDVDLMLPLPTLKKLTTLEAMLRKGGTFKVTIEREENEND